MHAAGFEPARDESQQNLKESVALDRSAIRANFSGSFHYLMLPLGIEPRYPRRSVTYKHGVLTVRRWELLS